MKKNVTRKNFSELDKFDKKLKRHTASKQKESKNKYSIYDDFDNDDLTNIYDYNDDFEDN